MKDQNDNSSGWSPAEENGESCSCGCHGEETESRSGETCSCGCHDAKNDGNPDDSCTCGCHSSDSDGNGESKCACVYHDSEGGSAEACSCGCHNDDGKEDADKTCSCGCHDSEGGSAEACSCGCYNNEKAETEPCSFCGEEHAEQAEISQHDDCLQQQQHPQQAEQPQEDQQHLQSQATQQVTSTFVPVAATASSAPTGQIVYEKGCVSAAWDDVKATKGWFGKVCLMALMYFVPVLNWVVDGYALRWARQLSLGQVEGLPKKIFCDRAFVNGAMKFLVSLVAAIAVSIVSSILGLVPFVGALAAIAFGIFVDMFMNIAYVRMSLFDELGEGFNIKEAFTSMKKEPGKAFMIEFMPSLIIFLTVSAVVFIATILCILSTGLAVWSAVYPMIEAAGSYEYFTYLLENDPEFLSQFITILLSGFIGLIPWILIGGFFANIFVVTCLLVQTRAAGHYVARYCAEWREDSKFRAVIYNE